MLVLSLVLAVFMQKQSLNDLLSTALTSASISIYVCIVPIL